MTIELIVIMTLAITLGSFGNNVITSLVGNGKLDLVKSICFCGEMKLKFWNIVPIFSFVFQRGRCRFCNNKISQRYLLVELISLIIAIILYIKYGISIEFLIKFAVFYLLFLIAAIDYYSFIIPNPLVLFLLSLAFVSLYIYPDNLQLNLIVASGAVLFFIILNRLIKNYKNNEGIGFGDIKLIFVLLLLFNFPESLWGIWLSSLVALGYIFTVSATTNKKVLNRKIPFGTFLAAGFFLLDIIGDTISDAISVIIAIGKFQ